MNKSDFSQFTNAGGSYSNMLGMNLARFKKFPQIKEVGMRRLPRMVAFTSDQCHYSNKKNASLLGLGTDDLIPVNTDDLGRMDVAHLQKLVDEVVSEVRVLKNFFDNRKFNIIGFLRELFDV